MWKQSVGVILVAIVLALALTGPTYGGFDALSDPDIVGWWEFNEGEGTLAVDATGNGNDGTLEGGAEWVPGVYGTAINFNGADAYVGTESSLLDNAQDFTMCGWVMARNASSGRIGLFGQNDLVEMGFMNGNVEVWTSATGTTNTAWTFPDTEWHHVAVVDQDAAMLIYIDGVEEASGSGGTHGTSSYLFNIGGGGVWDATGNWFDGQIDDVGLFLRALTQEEIQTVMLGLSDPLQASAPAPADEAIDIPRDTDLSWTSGEEATSHDVYFGTSFEDVNDGAGTLVSGGQSATTLEMDRLEFGQTYYWRVDELGGPEGTVKGEVWSFTVEPFAYPIANIIATSNATSNEGEGLENTVNGSGINADDQHSTNSSDMWLGKPGADPMTLLYEFDTVYKLHEMQVWNYNVMFELLLGFGLKDVMVEYSENGEDWTVLGDVVFNQATATSTYTANTTVAFDGVAAKYVRITVSSGYGMMGQFGLSEIRFLYIPVQAREPQPADGDTDVSVATALSWRAGREAASHEVSLGTDPEALASAGTVSVPTLTPAVLDLETTYYWQVTEVNDAEAVTAWVGGLWSFTTELYLVVDDFESYIDDEGGRIYETWIDGYGVNSNGSTVGHLESPFAEQDIVKSGAQSMPLFYNNAGAPVSEAEISLTQNWTESGVKTLSLQFHGAGDNTGTLYVKINGTKVPYDGAATDIAKAQWQVWNIDLSTVGGNLSNVTSLIVGIEGAGAEGVIYVDDVRLYPKTPEFITPVQPDAAGLVLHYAFDDGAGMTAADSSGNGNTGTLDGDPTWISGVSGGALDFDGTRDYVDSGASLLNELTEFTIAFWVKGDLSIANNSGLVGQNDCVEYGANNSNNIHLWSAGGGSVDLTWRYEGADEWHHLTAVGDGTALTIYLDGKPAATGGSPIDANYGTSTYNLNVAGGGIFGAVDNWFTGQLDEVYVYQRALSAAEVAGLAGRTEPVAQEF